VTKHVTADDVESSSPALHPGPLAGMRVIDLSNIIAGPMAATYLSDFGADVIKVERPDTGDSLRGFGHLAEGAKDRIWWKLAARNKQSLALDLHEAEAQETVRSLARHADVVIDGYRPGVLEGWNLGWEQLHAINERLIMCRVTGFGQTGPYRDRPGFGTLAEALSGFTMINGWPTTPPTLPPFGLADGVASIAISYAVASALYERERSGLGQMIDLALVEPFMSLLGAQLPDWEKLGIELKRTGNRAPWGAAPRGVYECADGGYLALSGATPSTVRRLFTAIGREDLNDDPRLQSNTDRQKHHELLDDAILAWTIRHPLDEALKILADLEVSACPIYDAQGVLSDVHFQERQSFVYVDDPELGPLPMPNVLARFSRTPGKIRHTGPPLNNAGEHLEEIRRRWQAADGR
jgi:crotonobetainyl-CoA:carnitine CoA-transferase CaiB-like acyl-CoA transferase